MNADLERAEKIDKQQKYEYSLFNIIEALHMSITGASDMSPDIEHAYVRLLKRRLFEWTPSSLNKSKDYDDCVYNLCEAVIYEYEVKNG